MLKSVFFRPLWLLNITIGAVLVFGTMAVFINASSNLNRFEPIKDNLKYLAKLQETGISVQEHVINALDDVSKITPEAKSKIHDDINYLLSLDTHLNEFTFIGLRKIQNIFKELEAHPREVLLTLLGEMESIIHNELTEHSKLVEVVHDEAIKEVEMSFIVIVLLVLMCILLIVFVKRKVTQPLNNLSYLMTVFIERDYQVVDMTNIEPIISPVFQSYNDMVERLQKLELLENARRIELERQVRAVTKTVIDQHTTLANSERLAYVGEISALVAHELRNPLSAIIAAIKNVKAEVESDDLRLRLDMVDRELNRVSQLLTNMLAHAKHNPEKPTLFNASDSIKEILNFASYTVPSSIGLKFIGELDIFCYLPLDRFRQAILNLVMNSAQAFDTDYGFITVNIKAFQNMLEVEVVDNGPGFSSDMDEIPVIAFTSEKAHGTGLGLAIVQRFAHEFGGTLRITKRYPKGTKATLMVRNES